MGLFGKIKSQKEGINESTILKESINDGELSSKQTIEIVNEGEINLINNGENEVIIPLNEEEKNTMASKLYRFYPENYIKNAEHTILINGNSNIQFEDMFSSLLFTIMIAMNHKGISDLHCEIFGDNHYRIQWRKNQSLRTMTKKDLQDTFDELELHKYGVVREKVFGIFEVLGKDELDFDLENYRECHFATREFITEFVTKLTADANSFNSSYKGLSTRSTIKFLGKKLSYRIEAIPTKYDGKTVFNLIVRLLAGKYIKPDYAHYQPIFLENLSGKGIFIIGGQTNSGKSTSIVGGLYDLHEIAPDKKYFSIENPIENPLPFATQLEVFIPIDRNIDNTMDFSDFSRSLFRGDGDTIFVGEIRDGETLNNSIKLSLSGHNIFSTIHITSVFDFFNRVIEYGKKPIEALNNTRLVVVQQLIKTYKDNTGILISDLKEPVADPFLNALINYNKTKEVGVLLKNFYNRTNRYTDLVKNNILLDQVEKKRKEFLKAMVNETSFAEYLIGFKQHSIVDEKGMRLMFEFLQVNERNKNLILDDDKTKFLQKEDVFIPMFVNAFFLDKQNFSLSDIFDLSKVVY